MIGYCSCMLAIGRGESATSILLSVMYIFLVETRILNCGICLFYSWEHTQICLANTVWSCSVGLWGARGEELIAHRSSRPPLPLSQLVMERTLTSTQYGLCSWMIAFCYVGTPWEYFSEVRQGWVTSLAAMDHYPAVGCHGMLPLEPRPGAKTDALHTDRTHSLYVHSWLLKPRCC